MNAEVLRELCRIHGFSLEMHRIPSDSREAYFAILVPVPGEEIDFKLRKDEIDLLRQKLVELCPSIEYVTIQFAAD